MKNPFSITLLFGISVLLFLQIQISAQATEYEMLVSSRNTSSVKRFNAQTGDYIDDFISTASGGLNTTQDVISGPGGNILVSGRGNTNILMYDKSTGDFIGPFTNGYSLNNPTKIAFGPDGNLYVSQWGTSNQKVARFNGTSGQFIDEFTPMLNLPLGQTWDASGNLYVACYGSADVRTFDTGGNFTGVFNESGHLQGPTNLWFDGNGSLFVIDWVLGSVIQFNASTGAFVRTFISGLQNAEGYAFGPDSNLYICDWSRNQIVEYTSAGDFIKIFTSQGNMQAPNSILFRPVQSTSVEQISNSIPENFSLGQNYPNPFNPSTKIVFDIPSDVKGQMSEVKLIIYDGLGREIRTIVNERLSPGSYSVGFDANGLAGGVYFYKLTLNISNASGSHSVTKKMLLIK